MKLITRKDFRSRVAYRGLIEGYSEGQLTAAGYDFRAGRCINLTTREEVSLEGGRAYRIHHGDFVIIATREKLNLRGRDDIFGFVFSKVSFASKGLSHVGTKIDPGFKGALSLSFDNRGYDIIEINENTSICNVALIEISPTGQEYTGGESNEPQILSERPSFTFPLPFPLTKEKWEDESLGLRRFYSKEAFDTYLQWSGALELEKKRVDDSEKKTEEALRQFKKEIRGDFERFKNEISAQAERSDRTFTGAVLTMFISAIAVTGVLLSAGALFLTEIRAQVYGGTIPTYTLIVIVFVVAIINVSLVLVLRSRRNRTSIVESRK